MKDKQLMKINRGVFYYEANDVGMQQQQLSLLHQVQKYPEQVGKKYDPSSILSAEDNCTIKQVGNPDGSITATIVYPNNPEGKDVIKTDPARNVVIQHNRIDKDGDVVSSAAIDNNGNRIKVDYVGFDRYIDIKDPNGRIIAGVTWEIPDGSVFSGYLNDDEKDGDPTTATSQNGMKTTVKPFNAIDPYYIDVRNPDGSLKTQMILHSDGTVEPGSKWTTPAPEPKPLIDPEENTIPEQNTMNNQPDLSDPTVEAADQEPTSPTYEPEPTPAE
jgi:hypothetical protein